MGALAREGYLRGVSFCKASRFGIGAIRKMFDYDQIPAFVVKLEIKRNPRNEKDRLPG